MIAAIVLALAPGAAIADPEPARPVVTDRGWQLDVTGFVQADLVAWDQSSLDEIDPNTPTQPLNQERFEIPRARLRAVASRDGMFGALEFDGNTLNGATARLLGAQVGWTTARPQAPADDPYVALTAGLFTIPFGVEVAADVRDKPFLEPPAMSRALFPGNFDAGAMVQGRYSYARWALAIMNGAPVGDAQWKGKDPTSSYDFLGRVGVEIPAPRRLRFEAGVSALAGKGLHPGVQPTKDGIQWVDDNHNGVVDGGEIQIVPGSPGEPSQTFSRNALGADLTVHWCVCAIGTGVGFFETILSTNLDRGLVYSDPVAASRDLRQLGYAIGAVQDVGDYAQLGVRYDRYDADRDAMDREGASLVNVHKIFSEWELMANARWHDARFTLEYDRVRNPFGRADNGAPTSLSADRIALRAQVGF
ncbi:MAG TPA: hypothetical protein VH165_33885 [Kofleriaceae bacterium]|jgi:hypothetical protein|nr:hypothetical protein [Kofleriaceae bacterium]